jgi:hypothetical protein
MFGRRESVLKSEVRTLGHPRAALLAFGVAVMAYNVLAVMLAAVATEHRLELTGLSREVAKASPRAPKQKVKKGYAPRREVDRHVSTARVLRGDERDTRTRGAFHEAGTRKPARGTRRTTSENSRGSRHAPGSDLLPTP